jgi:hypothetical protein
MRLLAPTLFKNRPYFYLTASTANLVEQGQTEADVGFFAFNNISITQTTQFLNSPNFTFSFEQ